MHLKNLFKFSRRGLKPYAAEFLGTALLVLIGEGVIAQTLLSDSQNGTWVSINLGFAAAVALTAFLADPSPAVNPAITLATALVRPSHQRWRQVPGKLLAQFLGAFVGAAIVYLNYRSAIRAWDPEYTVPGGSIASPLGHNSAGIFATYPAAVFRSNWEAVFQEALGTGVLMFGLLSIADGPNERFGAPQTAVFMLMLSIGVALGWQTGYAVNPARDFGPRLFSAIIYGSEVFTAANYYCFVPLLAPVLGALVAIAVYDAALYDGEGSIVADAADKASTDHHGPLRLLDD